MAPIRSHLLALCSASILQGQGLPAGAWKFDWSDEFNGAEVDASVWGYEIGYVRNKEHQYYSNRTENSRIEDGRLLLQARRDNWNGHAYTSASRTTWGKKSFKYGRFEMRARIDIRQGSWPAWWWLPNSGGWPKGGEIDMMEFYQGKCLFNVMDGNQKWTAPTRTITSLGGPRWAEGYHVWTMEWDSARIALRLDGVLINDYPVADADGTGPNGVNPFRQPGFMILNQAIGGTQGGDPSGTSFPVEMRVDWVRLHVWDPRAAPRIVTVKGGAGSGPYAEGTTASITANMPPAGQIFDRWVIEAGPPGAIDVPTSPTAVLTVPAGHLTVTATYKSAGSSALPIRSVQAGSAPIGAPAGLLPVYDLRGKRQEKRAPLDMRQGAVLFQRQARDPE